MPKDDRTYTEIIDAYNNIKNTRNNFGFPRKSIFHIHTPASHDYRLMENLGTDGYKKINVTKLEDMVYERNIIPLIEGKRIEKLGEDFDVFESKKEIYAYLLLANELLINKYEIVVVTDHNTFEGIDKLKICVNHLQRRENKYDVELNIFGGIEISCADKLHVVAILDGDKKNETNVNTWLEDKLISEKDGVYLTSLDVMNYFSELGALTYIAHIYSSNINKDTFLSGAYKTKLFSSPNTRIVGLKNKGQIEGARNFLNNYREDINFLIDNDSHSIDTLNENYFWIKGSDISFQMLKEALIDFDISISYEEPDNNKIFIEGLFIMYEDSGFLSGKRKKKPNFNVKFSDSLNCFIGGRGTGKSTVLEIIDFVMTQSIHDESILDFICNHGNVYILFQYYTEEYIIEFLSPYKDEDDNILSYFEEKRHYQYGRKYYFNKEKIKLFMLKEYLNVYEINSTDNDDINISSIKKISKRKEILSKLYDNRYSVNDLVRYASGDEINKFIYDLMFKNKELDLLENRIKFKKKTGLSKFLKEKENILEERRKNVESVINPFNETHGNTLKIDYSQNNLFHEYPVKEIYRNKLVRITQKYNITAESLEDFLFYLMDKKGLVEFLIASINKDSSWINPENLLEFTEEPSFKDIDSNKENIDYNIAKELISDLLVYATDDKNINIWVNFFKVYFRELEEYTILFNVNSREDNKNLNVIYKDIKKLSLGQKVVAMLDFILGYGKYNNDSRPVVIDQPEDNLDSRYIYKNLVQQLRKTKDERQVIIATHNATIVTNAMSDCVLVMESDGEHGWIKNQGYPGEAIIKQEIINHMEGGKDSFKHKVQIYKDVLEN
ncbi:Spaf_1101 family AAA-like ATPase [Anaerococcus cruorum]|uniref:Spaf_1101 family AAA-like ATPase n=1 Tax=Anaerococcus sp. WGS1529 TaxID=3366812 RepID=UPI00372CEE34